jgi:polar amino acid transport system substrate-binding protein
MRIFLFLLTLALCGIAQAQQQKLRVGIFERAPFAMKDAGGDWDGLAVVAWEKISADLSLPFEYIETPPEQAISDTAAGRLDVLVGEIAVSSDRARLIKFSQPYVVFPEAVAIRKDRRFPHWLDFTSDVIKHGVGTMLLVMLVAMIFFSLLLWLVERRVDSTHFGGHPIRGLGSALWFSAVTMTTVGYGDKTPQSVGGRVVVFFWMFIGVVAISVFTGTVASSLAVARVETSINSASALAHYRNGVAEGSISQSVLSAIGIPAKIFPTTAAGLRALETGEITAFVGSEVTLRYIVSHQYAGVLLVEDIPDTHVTYAFAMRPGLRERDAIDTALINEVTQPGWRQIMTSYIGPSLR